MHSLEQRAGNTHVHTCTHSKELGMHMCTHIAAKLLQQDLLKLAMWCAKWRIKLNPIKTKVIILSSVGKIHRLRKKCCVNWRAHGFPTKYICNFLFMLYLANFDSMYLNTSFRTKTVRKRRNKMSAVEKRLALRKLLVLTALLKKTYSKAKAKIQEKILGRTDFLKNRMKKDDFFKSFRLRSISQHC